MLSFVFLNFEAVETLRICHSESFGKRHSESFAMSFWVLRRRHSGSFGGVILSVAKNLIMPQDKLREESRFPTTTLRVETLHGACPEWDEILRYAQDDRRRRVQGNIEDTFSIDST